MEQTPTQEHVAHLRYIADTLRTQGRVDLSHSLMDAANELARLACENGRLKRMLEERKTETHDD